MHIEHKQFLELIAEASGIDLEKAEKQLSELISEIKQSLGEGEAYEIEGFGIFSSLGNRVMFIPSDELETEINFKYVGMEPIELDEPKPTFEDPFEGLDDEGSKSDSVDSRFAGLIDDDITDPLLEPEEGPGPEMWGVEAHKEDESADRLFASLMGEKYETPLDEAEGIDTNESVVDDDFSDVFADASESESSDDLGAELAALMSDDEPLEMEEPTTDDLLDDIFADNDGIDEDLGEDLIQDNSIELPHENEGTDEDDKIEAAPILNLETPTESDFEIELPEENIFEEELIEEEPNVDQEESVPELEENEDFDDPFYAIEEEQFDESVLRMEDLDETEIIPVIKNITTDVPEPVGEKEKSKKELQKEEKERKKQEEKDAKEKKKIDKERLKQEKKEAREKAKAENKSNTQSAPVWLWVVLIMVIVSGSVVGLGYFNVINIPFITPQTASNSVTSQPVQQQTTQTQQQVQATEQPSAEPIDNQNADVTAAEQATEPVVEEVMPEINNTLPLEGQYGLTGQVSSAGNDGYTIILYTLSNQTNAVNEAQKLIDAGYRAFLTPVPSERYGTLYRVSLGQFGSLFDAAVASEEVESLLPENFIIKKIN